MPTAGNKRKIGGFTLIELLITVAVAVVLATIAVPGFQNMVKTNRLAADYNEILASLNYARSEAVKRRKDVTAEIDGASDPWNITVTYQPDASSEDETLRVSEGRDGRVNISGPTEVVFNSLGRCGDCPSELSVQIAGEDSKKIGVSPSGNVRRVD